MPILEFDRTWTFTSTGAGGWESAKWAQNIQFIVETPPGSTAGVRLEHRRKGSTLVSLLSSATMASSAGNSTAFAYSGVFFEIRPRVTDMTSTGTVYVQGIGN